MLSDMRRTSRDFLALKTGFISRPILRNPYSSIMASSVSVWMVVDRSDLDSRWNLEVERPVCSFRLKRQLVVFEGRVKEKLMVYSVQPQDEEAGLQPLICFLLDEEGA